MGLFRGGGSTAWRALCVLMTFLQGVAEDQLSTESLCAQGHLSKHAFHVWPDIHAKLVCCAASCGGCGKRSCKYLPGGKHQCCTKAIIKDNRACIGENDTGCLLPRPKKAHLVNASTILWSRNWRRVVECEAVPPAYFDAPTPSTHPPEFIQTHFQDCGGIIWLRIGSQHSGGRETNDVATFARYALPRMTRPFILVTTDGDSSVPSDISHAEHILASPLCEAWFTQNYDASIANTKLKPIPIGFDLHTPWKGIWASNTSDNLRHMLRQRRKYFRARTRSKTLLAPPWSPTHPERMEATAALQCVEHDRGSRMGLNELWSTYGKYKFALSPRGGGLDCHRTWELLFFGVVPVVKSSPIDSLFHGLPVVIVQRWADICKDDFFEHAWRRVKPLWPAPLETFTLQHWVARLQPRRRSETVRVEPWGGG